MKIHARRHEVFEDIIYLLGLLELVDLVVQFDLKVFRNIMLLEKLVKKCVKSCDADIVVYSKRQVVFRARCCLIGPGYHFNTCYML